MTSGEHTPVPLATLDQASRRDLSDSIIKYRKVLSKRAKNETARHALADIAIK